MVGSNQVTVGTSATLLASVPPAAVNTGPVGAVLLLADATTDVYLGGSNVASTNGLKIIHAVTAPVVVPLYPGDALYAIVATGSATVGVLQV